MSTAPTLARSDASASASPALPDLLARLESLRVRLALSSDGRRIIIDAPRGAITAALKQEIAAHKGALLALLAPPDDLAGLDAASSPRAGLGELSGLACNRGARHHAYWLFAPDLAPRPRWVCRLCEPELYARVHASLRASQGAQQAQEREEGQEGMQAPQQGVRAPETRQTRQEAASALLTWGAAHGYPRQPYAWAQGASIGIAAPYLSIAPGADCWHQFSRSARGADLLAACRALGIALDVPAPAARADLLAASSARPDRRASMPGNAGNAQEHQEGEQAPATPRRSARKHAHAPDTLAVLDVSGLWIARPGAPGATSGEEITHITDGIPAPSPAVDAGALLALAREQGISQLWVHRSWALAAGLPERVRDARASRKGQEGEDSEGIEEEGQEQAHPFIAGAIADGWDIRPAGLAPWLYAFQRGTYGAIALALPHLETRLDPVKTWRHARDGRQLLAALLAYRAALGGYGYRRSPGATGTGLLRAVHSGNSVALDLSASAAPADFPAPARAGRAAPDLIWVRPLTQEERERCAYVHAYDKNAMYLGASSALPLGLGLPEHVTASTAGEEGAGLTFDKRLAGYWLARIEYTPPAGMPNPFAAPMHATDASGAGWYLSPMVELAYQIGAQVTLQEAHVWRSSHRIMAPWYERMRDARADLLARSADSTGDSTAATLALGALKATYTQTIGWLNGGWLRASETPEDLYRPDWRDSVMAQAAANLYRELLKVQTESGRVPFALDTDCAYFASDTPDALAACPAPLQIGTGLRHVKVKGEQIGAPLAPIAAILAQLDAPGASIRPNRIIDEIQRAIKDASTDARQGQEEA